MSSDGNNSTFRVPAFSQPLPSSMHIAAGDIREYDSPTASKGNALQRLGGNSGSSPSLDAYKGGAVPSFSSTQTLASFDNNSGAICGVGISVNSKTQPYMAVVSEIAPKSSADRDGTLKVGDIILSMDGASVENWTVAQLKSAMIGHVGTPLKLTIRKDDNKILDVNLIRGNLEYWEYVDATKRLQEQHREESEHLKSTLLKMKIDMEKLKMENDNLRMEIHQAADRHRWVETSVNLLGKEKQQLEEQVQDLLLQLAELSSSLRTAQAVSRDATDKARHSEQSRLVEEKLRKTAEAREQKAHGLLLSEIHHRKEIENSEALLRSRLSEFEAKTKAAIEIESNSAQLQCKVIELDSQLRQTTSEKEIFKGECSHRLEECKQLDSAKASLEQKVQRLIETNKQLQSRITELESELAQAEEAKRQAVQGYYEATQATAASDAVRQGAETHAASLKTTISMLRAEISDLQNQLENVSTSEKKLELNLRSRDVELAGIQGKLEATEARLMNVQTDHEKSLQKILALETKVDTLIIEGETKERERGVENDAWQRKEAALQEKIQVLDARLVESNDELVTVKAAIRNLEGKLASALVNVEAEQSNARILSAEKDNLLAVKKKLDADSAARLQEQTALQIALQHEKQVTTALEKTNAELLARCGDLNKQISNLQSQTRTLTNESENRHMRIQTLETQLESFATLKVANLALTSKTQELENLNGALMAENERMLASEKKTKSDMQAALQKIDELSTEMNRNKFEATLKYANAEKRLMETLATVTAEKDDLKTELERFYALPNPCGVGIGIEKCTSVTQEGGKLQIFKVSGMFPGQSAELSGAIKVGFELLEIDGIPTHTMSLEEARSKVSGKRGSLVTFKFSRPDEQNVNRKDFLVTLKRGSWGPEHCVVSFEDRDMIDEGRWPKPGSLSSAQSGALKKEDLARSSKFPSRH